MWHSFLPPEERLAKAKADRLAKTAAAAEAAVTTVAREDAQEDSTRLEVTKSEERDNEASQQISSGAEVGEASPTSSSTPPREGTLESEEKCLKLQQDGAAPSHIDLQAGHEESEDRESRRELDSDDVMQSAVRGQNMRVCQIGRAPNRGK